jgi:hypothetical protein
MKSHRRWSPAILVLAAFASVAVAQQVPPVHPLGRVLNTSIEPLASVSQVRALPGGRVIVNDNTGRRVVLFDSTLRVITVIADSTGAAGSAYSSRLGGLITYRGDSTLFVDPASLSMLVIDPNGKIVRTMAVPQANEAQNLIGGPFGTPGFDGAGRLVYRSATFKGFSQRRDGGDVLPPQPPDSAVIVRFDLKSRTLDTAATFSIPKVGLMIVKDDKGRGVMTSIVNPMPVSDDWALLADGTIAVVHGREYRVDLVGTDGKMTSAPKLTFEWQRLSDDDKVALIDSMKAVMIERTRGNGGTPGVMPAGLQFVSPTELADYRPAFRQGAARGDADGNLWVRTTKVANGGAVYDVISNKGALLDRVQVPPGRVIAGFGPGRAGLHGSGGRKHYTTRARASALALLRYFRCDPRSA